MTRTLLAATVLAAASLTPANATPGACTASDPHRPITSDCTTWTWPALSDAERAKVAGKPLVIQWFVADTEPQRLIGRVEITADTTTATFAHPLDAGTLCQVDVQVPRYWQGKPVPGGPVWLRGGTYPCPKTTNPTPTGSPTWTPQPSPSASATPSTSTTATGSTRPSSTPAAPKTPPASASPSRPATSAASPGPRSGDFSAELASTGTDTPWLLGTALALITAGGFLTRRRSARRH